MAVFEKLTLWLEPKVELTSLDNGNNVQQNFVIVALSSRSYEQVNWQMKFDVWFDTKWCVTYCRLVWRDIVQKRRWFVVFMICPVLALFASWHIIWRGNKIDDRTVKLTHIKVMLMYNEVLCFCVKFIFGWLIFIFPVHFLSLIDHSFCIVNRHLIFVDLHM